MATTPGVDCGGRGYISGFFGKKSTGPSPSEAASCNESGTVGGQQESVTTSSTSVLKVKEYWGIRGFAMPVGDACSVTGAVSREVCEYHP